MNNIEYSDKFLKNHGGGEKEKETTWKDIFFLFQCRGGIESFADWLEEHYHPPKEKKSYEKIQKK